jgi:hypothetical protein
MIYIIVDIDHTIADARWRDHLLPQWDAYFADQDKDQPIHEVVAILRSMVHYHNCVHMDGTCYVLAVTGRPERTRNQTLLWLKTNLIPVHEVLMRPDGDHTAAPELKLRLINGVIKDPGDIVFILEDDPAVVAALKTLGRPILQVHA